MTLISLIVTLVILGVCLYLINLIPMDGTIKKILNVLVILFIVLWLLQNLGIFSGIATTRIGRL